jgi:hypothetical protein
VNSQTRPERCLASSVAKAMEDKCEAERGRHPVERCLACEAERGRHPVERCLACEAERGRHPVERCLACEAGGRNQDRF